MPKLCAQDARCRINISWPVVQQPTGAATRVAGPQAPSFSPSLSLTVGLALSTNPPLEKQDADCPFVPDTSGTLRASKENVLAHKLVEVVMAKVAFLHTTQPAAFNTACRFPRHSPLLNGPQRSIVLAHE